MTLLCHIMLQVTFYTCIAFFIAWTPYTAFSMLAFFRHKDLNSSEMYIIPGLFAKMSWLYNPIIYFYMVKRFRKSAIATILCRENSTLVTRSLLNMTPRRTATKSSGETARQEYTMPLAECIKNVHYRDAEQDAIQECTSSKPAVLAIQGSSLKPSDVKECSEVHL